MDFGAIGNARAGWIAILSVATMIGGFIFACATPFPALGALAALYLTRRDAILLILVNWAANQAIGYGFLRYPVTWDSFAWGAAIGIAALAATAAAIGTEASARRLGWTAAALDTFLAAVVAYEGALYAATAFLPSDPGAFGFGVVSYIVSVNAVAFAGLPALHGIGRLSDSRCQGRRQPGRSFR